MHTLFAVRFFFFFPSFFLFSCFPSILNADYSFANLFWIRTFVHRKWHHHDDHRLTFDHSCIHPWSAFLLTLSFWHHFLIALKVTTIPSHCLYNTSILSSQRIRSSRRLLLFLTSRYTSALIPFDNKIIIRSPFSDVVVALFCLLVLFMRWLLARSLAIRCHWTLQGQTKFYPWHSVNIGVLGQKTAVILFPFPPTEEKTTSNGGPLL